VDCICEFEYIKLSLTSVSFFFFFMWNCGLHMTNLLCKIVAHICGFVWNHLLHLSIFFV
jgi:putative flippase GtrA